MPIAEKDPQNSFRNHLKCTKVEVNPNPTAYERRLRHMCKAGSNFTSDPNKPVHPDLVPKHRQKRLINLIWSAFNSAGIISNRKAIVKLAGRVEVIRENQELIRENQNILDDKLHHVAHYLNLTMIKVNEMAEHDMIQDQRIKRIGEDLILFPACDGGLP